MKPDRLASYRPEKYQLPAAPTVGDCLDALHAMANRMEDIRIEHESIGRKEAGLLSADLRLIARTIEGHLTK